MLSQSFKHKIAFEYMAKHQSKLRCWSSLVQVTRKEFLEFNEKELEMLLFKRLGIKKMHEAATTIQKCYKMYR